MLGTSTGLDAHPAQHRRAWSGSPPSWRARSCSSSASPSAGSARRTATAGSPSRSGRRSCRSRSGWFLGHDLTLLLGEGQNAYALISDPFGRGWDLFGTYDHTVDYSILTEPWVPWVQLALIAVGHVASVVLLHELAMERLAPRAAMRTTWVMAAVCSASITAACMLVLT